MSVVEVTTDWVITDRGSCPECLKENFVIFNRQPYMGRQAVRGECSDCGYTTHSQRIIDSALSSVFILEIDWDNRDLSKFKSIQGVIIRSVNRSGNKRFRIIHLSDPKRIESPASSFFHVATIECKEKPADPEELPFFKWKKIRISRADSQPQAGFLHHRCELNL